MVSPLTNTMRGLNEGLLSFRVYCLDVPPLTRT